MTIAIVYKLLAIIFTVVLGYVAGRMQWLGRPQDGDPARVLGNVAFFIFVPALLFRTTARLDTSTLPWAFLFAFFVPVLAVVAGIYLFERWRLKPGEAVAVARERMRQELDRNVALQLRVSRAVHLAHAARADQRLHVVRSEPPALDHQRCGVRNWFDADHRGRLEKAPRAVVRRQERLHFLAQCLVAGAGCGEVGLTVRRRQRLRAGEHLFQALTIIRRKCHDCGILRPGTLTSARFADTPARAPCTPRP